MIKKKEINYAKLLINLFYEDRVISKEKFEKIFNEFYPNCNLQTALSTLKNQGFITVIKENYEDCYYVLDYIVYSIIKNFTGEGTEDC